MNDAAIKFIDEALREGQSFALVLLPGSEEPICWSEGASAHGSHRIRIAPWLAEENEAVYNLDDSKVPDMELERESTDRAHYLKAVAEIADRCRLRNGKTVYSRVVCGEATGETTWGQKADRLFRQFPDTFRFIYYTPRTLGWLGATPEVLLDFDKTSGHFSSMSLAGTRSAEQPREWDQKNIAENRFVTDFIADRLRQYAPDVTVSPPKTLRYGPVEHLLHIISGNAAPEHIPAIISAINPTPALCGFPREDAIADINELERHRRNCYGGYIAVESDTRFTAFVNLRCIHFSGNHFCAYGGGGITSASDPETEFYETAAKMSKILPIIGGDTFRSEYSR